MNVLMKFVISITLSSPFSFSEYDDMHPVSRLEKVHIHFINLTTNSYKTVVPYTGQAYAHDSSILLKQETKHHLALKLHESCLTQIVSLEMRMGISNWWDLLSPEYLETLGYLNTRSYQQALEELQRLVIQWLFKLHKMNMLATGEYNLRFWIPQS